MKRFAVVGKHRNKVAALVDKMQKLGFVLDRKKPEFVVSYGGDGTFLHSERLYPGVPKLLAREGSTCYKCSNMLLGAVLRRIASGKFRVESYNKIEAAAGKRKLIAANDIIIRNDFPGHAIRFFVSVNRTKSKLLIGDGIVVASVFGSTGYFKSITGRTFGKGIGIAFNNVTEKAQHAVVAAKSKIVFRLARGSAVVVADNNAKVIHIGKGSAVSIRQSRQAAKVIVI